MLKQLIDVKSNKIFVLQTVGKGTSCPACVWQADLHTGTAAVCEPAHSFTHDSYRSLWFHVIHVDVGNLMPGIIWTFKPHLSGRKKPLIKEMLYGEPITAANRPRYVGLQTRMLQTMVRTSQRCSLIRGSSSIDLNGNSRKLPCHAFF